MKNFFRGIILSINKIVVFFKKRMGKKESNSSAPKDIYPMW